MFYLLCFVGCCSMTDREGNTLATGNICNVILFIVVHFCNFHSILNTFSHLILIFSSQICSSDFIVIRLCFWVFLGFFWRVVFHLGSILQFLLSPYFGKKPSSFQQVVFSWNHVLGFAMLSAWCLLENWGWNHRVSLSRYNVKLYIKVFITNQDVQNHSLSLLCYWSLTELCTWWEDQ